MYWFAIVLLMAASAGVGFCACLVWMGRRMQRELHQLISESDRIAAEHAQFMQMLADGIPPVTVAGPGEPWGNMPY